MDLGRDCSFGLHRPRQKVDGGMYNRLGRGLGLGLLLLSVLGQALLSELGGLLVLFLLIAAEQIDVVILLLGGRRLGRVDSNLGSLGAVRAVGLGGIAGQSRELILEGRDVLPPSGRVRVLLGSWAGLQSLENGDIGLGDAVSVCRNVSSPDTLSLSWARASDSRQGSAVQGKSQSCNIVLVGSSICRS